jgi:hypothetical protein
MSQCRTRDIGLPGCCGKTPVPVILGRAEFHSGRKSVQTSGASSASARSTAPTCSASLLVRDRLRPTKMQPVHNVVELVFSRRDERKRDDLAFRE